MKSVKKSVAFLVSLMLLILPLSSIAIAAEEEEEIEYEALQEDILNPIGAASVWDSQTNSILFKLRNGVTGKVTVGSDQYHIGQTTGTFAAAVMLDETTVLIPEDDYFVKKVNLENASANTLDVAHQDEAKLFKVKATMETQPTDQEGDSADDPSIWVHPTNANESLIIGANKKANPGGIEAYNLDGVRVGSYGVGKMNNVDVRYNFMFGGQNVDIAASTNRTTNTINIFVINAVTGVLTEVTGNNLASNMEEVYGFSLYQSQRTGKMYGMITGKEGEFEQWELYDNGQGQVDGTLVREIKIGSVTEGIVADDEYGKFYVSEENVAIWRYNAEPDGGLLPEARVDTVDGIRLTADAEGLTIYYGKDGEGYLIASSQGSDRYVVYDREDGEYMTTFMVENGTIDGTSETDGLDVLSFGLGSKYPHGVFVTQDNNNFQPDGTEVNQNYKVVPWNKIADGSDEDLEVDSQDPRKLKKR
ncbi:MAG: phytase [Candidatus Pristimantibacillus sp.]